MLRKVCSRCVSRKVQTVDALTLGSAGYALARLFLQEIRSFVCRRECFAQRTTSRAVICRRATAAMLKRSSAGARAGFARKEHVHFKNASFDQDRSSSEWGHPVLQEWKRHTHVPAWRDHESSIIESASWLVCSSNHRCAAFLRPVRWAVDRSRPAQGWGWNRS